ncbi:MULTISPECIES: dihydrofolate reductase family protein [Actinoplanes]|uniref:Deaminase n=2 Tax=Actinoplanes TaxID=1865 RepID=A0A101JEE6_9ACTN|nr:MULTISPECIES: dihydrofolate reductase family protein [Actinoplanes]KUL25131.1 deaminase [Actinoplanes awajinensis subsp. mycoplanecinus]GIE68794.1 deaminase [Actinoplanes palleronii]
MARLICTGITSLDGYITDEQGEFDWSEPDEEVHAFVNDLERSIGTYLYGRRLYEVMRYWEDAHTHPGSPAVELDYARLWQAADKIVYSTSLETVTTARTRIERVFDPKVVQALKDTADRDLSIGGPHLAAHAFRAALVDEVQLFISPVAVGGGTRFLPSGVRLDLRLAEQRRFTNGVVYLRYRAA